MSKIGDFLFPPRCCSCGALCDGTEYRGALCAECGAKWKVETFKNASNERCAVEGTRWLLYLTHYTRGGDSVGSRMILHAKNRCRNHFFRFIAEEMKTQIVRYLDFPSENTVIVYVPRRRSARRQKGFDQSQMLARALGKSMKIPSPDVLINCEKTAQKELNQSERRRNAQQGFRLRNGLQKAIQGKHILLIDDIVTTGATVTSCTRTLLEAGVAVVDVVAIGRTSRPLANNGHFCIL